MLKNKDITFQIPKFEDRDQPMLDQSLSKESQKTQFQIYSYKNSIFAPNLSHLPQPKQSKGSKSKSRQSNQNGSFFSFMQPSLNSILTPLNVMKASESSSQEIQNTTTFGVKSHGNSNVSSLSSKPLDDILEKEKEKTTSVKLTNNEFHFQPSIDLQKQGSNSSTMSIVHTEKTANENNLKFFTGIEMLNNLSSIEFSSGSDESPFSKELFSKVNDLEDMLITKEFLSITKKSSAKWETLKPQILKLIISFKRERKNFVNPESDVMPEQQIDEDSPELIIREILKDKVRPLLMINGADIELVELDGFDLTLKLKGSYKNFPSAQEALEKLILEASSSWVPIKNILFV